MKHSYSYRNLADEGVDPDDDYSELVMIVCPLCRGSRVLVIRATDALEPIAYYCTECQQNVTEAVRRQLIADAEATAARDAWERSEEGRHAQAAIDVSFAEWRNEQAADGDAQAAGSLLQS